MAERSFTPLQQAAQSALEIQNAVSLSGVVRSLYETVDVVLWAEGKGTKYVNTHPIVTLFLHKLISLNGSDCFCSACISNYGRATAEVEKIASGTNGTGVRP